jgi:signal transduction histidine kinase
MLNYKLKLVYLSISIFAHIISYVQFNLKSEDFITYQSFNTQFIILLFFSLVISIALPFLLKKHARWVLVSIKGLIILLISLPINGYINVELLLMTTTIFESFTYTSVTGALLYTIIISILAISFQHLNISVFNQSMPTISIHDSLTFFSYLVIITIIAVLINYKGNNKISLAELNKRLNNATIKLVETNIKLQEYAAKAQEKGAENERKYVAREIHDSMAYTLTNIIMMIKAGITLIDNNNPTLVKHLKKMLVQAQEGLNDVRQALKIIREPTKTNTNSLKKIKQLVDSFMDATDIEIQLSFGNVHLYFEEEVEKTVYRLIQEGITNAIRHGMATKIEIILTEMNKCINVYIKDNGVGCESIPLGYGLLGIQERIEKIDGELQIKSEATKGFILSAWIPLKGVKC